MTLEEFGKYIVENNCGNVEGQIRTGNVELCCMEFEYEWDMETNDIKIL